jgi:hypothetical protein
LSKEARVGHVDTVVVTGANAATTLQARSAERLSVGYGDDQRPVAGDIEFRSDIEYYCE